MTKAVMHLRVNEVRDGHVGRTLTTYNAHHYRIRNDFVLDILLPASVMVMFLSGIFEATLCYTLFYFNGIFIHTDRLFQCNKILTPYRKLMNLSRFIAIAMYQ